MDARELLFERLFNLRDVGGLTTAEGTRVRPGRLYRSEAAWANRTPQLRGLGITCTDVADGSAEFAIPAVPYAPNTGRPAPGESA